MASFGVVFDIDGVLLRHSPSGYVEIPGAGDALAAVRDAGAHHVFVSNGTGDTEDSKARSLSKVFGYDISGHNVLLPTTPMRSLETGKRKLLLAASHRVCETIAQAYGWTNWVSGQDYAKFHPWLFPFADCAPPSPDGPSADEARKPVEAIFVLQSPSDWQVSMQLMCDLVRSNGVPGAEHEDSTQPVRVYFGNPDLEYGATHSVPRITLGAFRECVMQVYRLSTGRDMKYEQFGKPFEWTFRCAEGMLDRAAQLQGGPPVERIYMIGDNPLSDIKGANDAGGRWRSVLVRTGCFQGGDNDARHPAWLVCDDVKHAVAAILERERGLLQ